MVKDLKTGECFRADHLIKATAEKIISEKNTTKDVKNDLDNICAMVQKIYLIIDFLKITKSLYF